MGGFLRGKKQKANIVRGLKSLKKRFPGSGLLIDHYSLEENLYQSW